MLGHHATTTPTDGHIRSSHTFVNLHDVYQSQKAKVECSIGALRHQRAALAAEVKKQLASFRYIRFRLKEKLVKSKKVVTALSDEHVHVQRLIEQWRQVKQMQVTLDRCELQLLQCNQSKLIEVSDQLVDLCMRASQQ